MTPPRIVASALVVIGLTCLIVGVVFGASSVTLQNGAPCGSYFSADEAATTKASIRAANQMYDALKNTVPLDELVAEGERQESENRSACAAARSDRGLPTWSLISIGAIVAALGAAVFAGRITTH